MKRFIIGAAFLATATIAVAQDSAVPIKVGVGEPYGSTQTSSTVADPQVDGKVLRVVIGATEKPWLAGVNAPIGEKLKQGDRVKVTLWLRGTPAAAGVKPLVQIGLQESAAPYTAIGKSLKVELTDRFAPYVIEAIIPKAMGASKTNVAIQLGFVPQTVDIAAVQAVKIPIGDA